MLVGIHLHLYCAPLCTSHQSVLGPLIFPHIARQFPASSLTTRQIIQFIHCQYTDDTQLFISFSPTGYWLRLLYEI